MKHLLIILILTLSAFAQDPDQTSPAHKAGSHCINVNYDDSLAKSIRKDWEDSYRTYRTAYKICMVGTDTAFIAHYYNTGELEYVSMKMIGEIEVPVFQVGGVGDYGSSLIQYGKNVMVIRVNGKSNILNGETLETYEFSVNKTADGHKCNSTTQCKQLNKKDR